MKCELTTINPSLAADFLRLNISNRAVNPHHVARLSREMKEGRWKLNGDTICINGERLIDGQHRLMAVVSSGVTIQSLVVYGLPSDVFNTKDVGKRRSGCDTLSVLGEKNCALLASALTIVDKYITGRSERNINYSNAEIEMLLSKYPGVRASVPVGSTTKGLIPPSAITACHYLFSLKDKPLADRFFDGLISGVGLNEDDPVYLLRERLMQNSLAKAKLDRCYLIALTIKAWNAKRAGINLKTLRYSTVGGNAESFPVIM